MAPKKKSSPKSRRAKNPPVRKHTARKIPEHHWKSPMSFRSDGSLRRATLAEFVDPGVPTFALAELSEAQREELVLARIARRRGFPLIFANGGYVDRARAVTEVRNRTAVGQVIDELELRMMRRLIEKASPKRSPRDFDRKDRHR